MSSDNEILIWKLTPRDSSLVIKNHNLKPQAHSLDEASRFLPGGAYTTLRTYSRTKVMHIEDHFRRLEESAQRVDAGIQPWAILLRPALKQIINASPYSDARLRVTLDLEIDPGCYFVALERLHTPPAEAYQQGVRAVTNRMQRDNPKAKLTNFLTTASKFRAQLPPDVNEMLMVDQKGVILEGLSSNFYGVIAGTIWTVEEGVLLGLTRSAVLGIADQNGIPVTIGEIRVTQIETLDECFITSASRGVLPVVQIDDTVIGSGKPGGVTNKLIRLFDQWVKTNVEEI